MDERVARVALGWINLSQAEREEVQRFVNAYFREEDYGKSRSLKESLQRKADVGPYASSTTCPCCKR